MTRIPRTVLVIALVAASAFAGWRIVAHTVADGFATSAPERALGWLPDHPGALLTLAERQLAANDDAAATATARHLLRVAPLEGRALRILGAVAVRANDAERARTLYQHAAILSPRDVPTHTWLIRRDVTAGDYPAALTQMDRLMRISPAHRAAILPLMAELAQLPAFIDALAPTLAANPSWRGGFLAELNSGRYPQGAARVAAALAQSGGLDAEERIRRIDSLIAQNAWGKAYAFWASDLPAGTRLPLVYNGDFAHVPTGQGFDWRVRHVPGAQVRFVTDVDGDGLMAHVVFRRRPVADAGLEQPLLLAPGDYRLTVRMRGDGLQSQRGLEWTIQCAGGAVVGRSTPIDGSFPWRTVTADVRIDEACPGQWLQLRNRVPSGSGQFTSGELWIDDVVVTPRAAE